MLLASGLGYCRLAEIALRDPSRAPNRAHSRRFSVSELAAHLRAQSCTDRSVGDRELGRGYRSCHFERISPLHMVAADDRNGYRMAPETNRRRVKEKWKWRVIAYRDRVCRRTCSVKPLFTTSQLNQVVAVALRRR